MSKDYSRLRPEESSFKQSTITAAKGVTVSQSRVRAKLDETVNIPDVIDWPHSETHSYLASLEGNYNLETWDIPIFQDAALYRHIYRLKQVLLWWWDSPVPNKIGNPYSVMYECLSRGPEFADELADSVDYSMRLSAGCCATYGKECYPPVTQELENMDQLFHPSHLIPFRRPASNDIDYLFTEGPHIADSVIQLLREEIRSNIKVPVESMRTLDDLDRIALMGSQTCFVPQKNMREPKSIGRLKSTDLSMTKHWIYDSVEVMKQPHESRDAVVADTPTACTLYTLRLRLRQVIRLEEDVIWTKDFSWLPEWLSAESKKLFLMSDQKKCGLTFPRRLLIVLFEELHASFPSWGFDCAVEGLSNSWVKDYRDGILKRALGGPGLGQLSEAISLITAMIFKIWSRDQDPDLHLEGLFFNDDQVIRFDFDDLRADPLPLETQQLGLSWDVHMESFGLQVHKKKPFIAKGGLLLEIYGTGFPILTPKKIQWIGNFFKTLCQSNIAAAKEYFSNMFDNIWEDEQWVALNILRNTIIPFWGQEFCPQEELYPYQFGGWHRFRSPEKLDLAYLKVHELPPKRESLINLFWVKHESPKGGKVRDKNVLKLIDRTKELLNSETVYQPAVWDYGRLAAGSVGITRPTDKRYLKNYDSWLKRRAEAFKERPRPIQQFFSTYWKTVIDEGKAYAPPLSVYHEGNLELPYGSSADMGKPHKRRDLVRSWFRLCQSMGHWKKYSFYSEGGETGSDQLLYHFLNSLDIGEFKRCPDSIVMSMLVGSDQVKKLIDFGLRTYGRIILPKPPDIFPDFMDLCQRSNYDDIIMLNHTAQLAINSRVSASFEAEDFRIQKECLGVVTNYILNDSSRPDLSDFTWSWEVLEQVLNSRVQENRHINRLHENVPAPIVGEEDRQLLAYLIHQIMAPDHLFAPEEAIRQDLAAQIYGLPDDAPDFFADDEEEGFGSLW